jgi:GxxExxY protein
MTELIYADLTYAVRGAIYTVYNELHHLGLSEAGWEKALIIALKEQSLEALPQIEYELNYKGYRIGRFFVDILVEDKLLLELKVKERVQPIDEAQVMTYLKISGLKLALLVNFGDDKLDIKRIPNFMDKQSSHSSQVKTDPPSDQWLYPALTEELRAILYEVHNQLGPGFMHMHYRRATQIELRLHNLPYQVKREVVMGV